MPLRKRRLFSFENMTLVFAMISIGLNIIFAIVKIVFSFIISNYFFLISGIFTACLILAKFVCVKGIKENNKKFKTKNLIISIIVLLAGIIYIVYSLRLILYKDYNLYNYPMYMGILISLISFIEVGLAISGLIQVKKYDHFYRDIKIIAFISSLTALVLSMSAILSFTTDIKETKIYVGYFGVVVGGITSLLALLIYFIPRYSIYDREHNVFKIVDKEKSKKYFYDTNILEIPLSQSILFKRYVYRGYLKEDILDGHIEIIGGLFNKLNVFFKILFIIFYPIIFIPHMFLYMLYILRTYNIPKRLEVIMNKNGLEKIENI